MVHTLDGAPVPFEGTEIHTLPNGLKILFKEDHTIPVVAMQAWARCGAVDEAPHLYGISHGLEHMVFKGTPTRSAGHISRIVESNGGIMNAATQLETTHYYIDIPAYGAKAALEVLADTIIRPIFPEEELERERLVILEEINRRDDSPDATLWDSFASNVFKGTPYEIKVIGSRETVGNLKRQDLLDYYKTHYVPEKLTLVIAGDINRKEMLQQIFQLFGEIKVGKAPPTPLVKLNGHQPTHETLTRPVQTSYLATGFPTVGLNHADTVKLDVLADVLCGGHSSRFFQKIREEQKKVLSIHCDYIAFSQMGLFAFFMECLPGQSAGALETLQTELGNLLKNPIQESELRRAKARIKSGWLHEAETPNGQASILGGLHSLGRLDLVASFSKDVDALTSDQINETAQKYLQNVPMTTTQVDPLS